MKKRLISFGIIAALSMGVFAGCGSDAGTSNGTNGTEAGGSKSEGKETVSIYVYGNDQEQAMYSDLFKKFEEENNCTVDAQFSIKDDYGTTITGMMQAKNLPDVFYIGPENVSQYVENGYVLDMKPVLESNSLDTSDILQDILGMYEYDGGLYGLPHDSSVFAYAYNKDLFDEAGIPYPDPNKPYTYEEYLDVCQKLTKDKDGDGVNDQFGCAFANAFMLYQFIWGNDASFCSDDYKTVTVTDPKFVEALEKWTDLVVKYQVSPSVEQAAATNEYERWLAGEVGMYACGTWDVAAFMDPEVLGFNWDLCGYPTLSNGTSTTWCGTVGYCVSAATKNEDLATKLAYYMSASDEAMKLLSGIDGGASIQIPNLVSMAGDEFAAAVEAGTLKYPDNFQVFFNYLGGQNGYSVKFMETTFTPNAEWMDRFFEGLDTVKDGSVTPAEYCEKVAPEMQELLDDAWDSVE